MVTRTCLLAAAAALLCVTGVGAWWFTRASDHRDVDLPRPSSLDAVVRDINAGLPSALQEADVPGAAVAVVAEGETVWSGGSGVTTAGGGEVTEATVFEVGSISKPVAAATILALADKGVLDLDARVVDSLTDWLMPADFPDPDAVTLRHLLAHTAGTDTPGYQGLPADQPLPTTAESLEGAATGSPVHQSETPGEYAYSGGGFTIAQLVAEDVTDRPFRELAERYVFDPLGMASSSFTCTRAEIADPSWAAGHESDGATTPRYRYAEAAAGGVCSTADDLAKFAAWLATDESTPVAMRTPADGTDGRYGLGLELYGGMTVGHIGVNRGFNAQLVVNPDEDLGLVMLTNGDRGAEVIETVLDAWPGA